MSSIQYLLTGWLVVAILITIGLPFYIEHHYKSKNTLNIRSQNDTLNEQLLTGKDKNSNSQKYAIYIVLGIISILGLFSFWYVYSRKWSIKGDYNDYDYDKKEFTTSTGKFFSYFVYFGYIPTVIISLIMIILLLFALSHAPMIIIPS